VVLVELCRHQFLVFFFSLITTHVVHPSSITPPALNVHTMSSTTAKLLCTEVLAAFAVKIVDHGKSMPDASHEELEDWEIWGKGLVKVWVSLSVPFHPLL
jgi:hypothetical protein